MTACPETFYLYILYSFKNNKCYVGQTDDLENRLIEHNNGRVQSTSKNRPWVIVYKEIFISRSLAMKREKFFKSLYGTNLKKKIIKEFLSTP